MTLKSFFVVAIALFLVLTGCSPQKQLPLRPTMPAGIPNLLKGEGPKIDPTKNRMGGDWFLHCGGTRGWAHRNSYNKCDDSRQILITKVPKDSAVRYKLKVGDVVLGVNGQYFDSMPIYQFRRATIPARDSEGQFTVILWRKGWEIEKNVTLDLAFKPLDFTRGDEPGLETDWNLGATGARGYMNGRNNESLVTRQILITEIEKGSPAEGKLEKGDIILGVAHENFKSDARKAFAQALTRAESKEGQGRLSIRRWRKGEIKDITISIPVLGSYSESFPWNCEKSERILENALTYMTQKDILFAKGFRGSERALTALAFLSTGEKKYIDYAKKYVYKIVEDSEKAGKYPPSFGYASWGWGYHSVLLSEYFLLTRDKKVKPTIEKLSNLIAEGSSGVGSWGHRFAQPNHGRCYGYGSLNQPGIICWMGLNYAQRCGITNPEIELAIERGAKYFTNFVDQRAIPYGDNLSLSTSRHDDNGKCSSVACAFSIFGDKKATEYFSRMTIASFNDREWGHTGVWWSLLWGPLGAARSGQGACSAFLNKINWLHELERRWDGGFIYQGKMNTGYGINPKNGRQYGGSEHQYGHWDTTACRVLMYTLPRKKLLMTGKDVLVIPLEGETLKEVLSAGETPEKGQKFMRHKYDGQPPERLLELLGNWSPADRYHAAISLAKNGGDFSYEIKKLLHSKNRFAQYGACQALQQLGKRAEFAINDLIVVMNTKDRVLRANAIMALGATGNKRALEFLLHIAAGEFENDYYDYLHRFTAKALFNRKNGMLHKSIEGVDRKLLYPAVKRFLKCLDASSRGMVAESVLKKLSFAELKTLWPSMIPALEECALTEIGGGATVRLAIAEILTKYKVKEGMPLILKYMDTQKGHGGGAARRQQIMDYLIQYGANAKPLLPEMQKYIDLCSKNHKHSDRSRPSKANFYKANIPFVQDAMKKIEASEKKPKMKSIKKYLN